MKLSGKTNKVIAGGFGVAFMLLGLVSFSSYQNATKLIESDDKVRYTHRNIQLLTEVLTSFIDAESGRRGYLLFSDAEELDRYHISVQKIEKKINNLRKITAKNPAQQQRLNKLENLLYQRINLYQNSVDSFPNKPPQPILVVETKENQQLIRNLIAEMQKEEEEFLEKWVKEYESTIQTRMVIEWLGTLVSFAILFGMLGVLYRQTIQRQKAEIIQRRLAQEKELSELKLGFFSMVSHEFRTPLSIILGSAQLLAENNNQQADEKKLKNINRILSSAKLMTQLLTDILMLTRAEAGKLECQRKSLDLEYFCLNLIEDIQLSNAAKHPINFTSETKISHANLDEKLLYSILGNLLSNALKYSPEGTPIDFILSTEQKNVIFQIKDQGIGINERQLGQVFEPFFRGTNVETIVGTGLGLAVVKKCVELHQGEISIHSELGVGTIFTVKITQE